jgi:hypothetical protein
MTNILSKMLSKMWSKFDDNIHLRIFLKGLEASFIIIFSIKMYEVIKQLIEVDLFKHSNLPIEYHTVISHMLHLFSILIAEIFLVYLLIILFQTEF